MKNFISIIKKTALIIVTTLFLYILMYIISGICLKGEALVKYGMFTVDIFYSVVFIAGALNFHFGQKLDMFKYSGSLISYAWKKAPVPLVALPILMMIGSIMAIIDLQSNPRIKNDTLLTFGIFAFIVLVYTSLIYRQKNIEYKFAKRRGLLDDVIFDVLSYKASCDSNDKLIIKKDEHNEHSNN